MPSLLKCFFDIAESGDCTNFQFEVQNIYHQSNSECIFETLSVQSPALDLDKEKLKCLGKSGMLRFVFDKNYAVFLKNPHQDLEK